jgi:biotin synthase
MNNIMDNEIRLKKHWIFKEVNELYNLSLPELIFQASYIHRQNFRNDEIELCTLLSIKTGSCPEDCKYCPQSAHYKVDIEKEKLLSLGKVVRCAQEAKLNGASRLCMGAAWKNPSKHDLPKVIEMIKAVKDIGLETCVTLGMLDAEQAKELSDAGLDFYNHNLDTSPDYYKEIITTRTYDDRLNTLKNIREAGINVCCGGIIGMGESHEDRVKFLMQLANLPEHPISVPINKLVPIKGTPLATVPVIDDFDFIRTIAVCRIMMPKSVIRLSAGRKSMSRETQALCFIAGGNSVWLGKKLLTTDNNNEDEDKEMFSRFGMKPKREDCVAPL